jgi:hypothetical protein
METAMPEPKAPIAAAAEAPATNPPAPLSVAPPIDERIAERAARFMARPSTQISNER